MRSTSVRLGIWNVLASLAIMAVVAGPPASAQDKAPPAAKARAKSTEPGKGEKRGGILPAYFRSVVDEKQRDAIYKIQEEYAAKIADLKTQLTAVTKERDARIAALLTPDQQKKIEQLQAEAKGKREQKATAKTPPTGASPQKTPQPPPAK